MDRHAELRAALDAGPTPGPWTVRYDYVVQATSFDGGRLVPVAQPYGVNSDGTDLFANARMIAACHPEVIRALLAERDALRVALTELCDEIDKHEIHAAISQTSISWFKRKARAALALAQEQGGSDDNQD